MWWSNSLHLFGWSLENATLEGTNAAQYKNANFVLAMPLEIN